MTFPIRSKHFDLEDAQPVQKTKGTQMNVGKLVSILQNLDQEAEVSVDGEALGAIVTRATFEARPYVVLNGEGYLDRLDDELGDDDVIEYRADQEDDGKSKYFGAYDDEGQWIINVREDELPALGSNLEGRKVQYIGDARTKDDA